MRELDPRTYGMLLASHPLLCLSTRLGRTNNIIPLTWYMPASQQPPVLGFVLQRTCYSHELLRETGECVLGIPDLSILKELHYCGMRSGRDIEKLRLLELSTTQATCVSPLVLPSCLANLEASVWDLRDVGDRANYLVKIQCLTADEVAWDGKRWTSEAELVYHHEGHTYRCCGKEIVLSREAVQPDGPR